jgi:hypothetical protein
MMAPINGLVFRQTSSLLNQTKDQEREDPEELSCEPQKGFRVE